MSRASDPGPASAAACRRTLTLDSHLPSFDGHFPGEPVLPGAAQLATLVLPAVAEARPEWGPLRRATRLKFRRPLRPGDRVTLHLAFAESPGRVAFRIEVDGELSTSGTLELRAPADARAGT